MIIQELDAEIAAHEACVQETARMRDLEDQRAKLEDELRFYQAHFKELSKGVDSKSPSAQAERTRVKRAVDRVRAALRSIDAEHTRLEEHIALTFHPYWGSLLKENHEMSSFGLQVDIYADIYTRRASCLQAYSPQQFFRSPHDLMPHEL